MTIQKENSTIINKHSVETEIEITKLCAEHNVDIDIQPFVTVQSASNELDIPINFNPKRVKISTSTVTPTSLKVIYNAYRENNLNCMLRTGIIPNYEELIEPTIKLLELICLFVKNLKNKIDINYFNTVGMTATQYTKAHSMSRDKSPKLKATLNSLGLEDNYTLRLLHYNLLSGSTIIKDTSTYLTECQKASEILTKHCNQNVDDSEVKQLLVQYQSYKNAYSTILLECKESTMNTVSKTAREMEFINQAIDNLESGFKEDLSKIKASETKYLKQLEARREELVSKLSACRLDSIDIIASLESLTTEDLYVKAINDLLIIQEAYTKQQERINTLNSTLASALKPTNTENIGIDFIIDKIQELIKSNEALNTELSRVKTLSSYLKDCD